MKKLISLSCFFEKTVFETFSFLNYIKQILNIIQLVFGGLLWEQLGLNVVWWAVLLIGLVIRGGFPLPLE